MSSEVQVILNPKAGGGGARKLRPGVERELAARGVRFAIEETRAPGHAAELARSAAERGIERLVVVGGDGTIHEAANGLLESRARPGPPATALAVVPAGTGNDFIKMVDGVDSRQRAYDAVATGSVRRFDVGRVVWDGGSEFFVNGIGLGIDVEVVRQVKRLPHFPGVFAYLAGLLKALFVYEPAALKIGLDGDELEQRVMIIAVSNGACMGGGFYLCPAARPDDGRFDLCIVDEIGWFGIARVIPGILRGRHGELPFVKLRQAAAVRIEAADHRPLFFQVDGELREPAGARWLRVELEHGALSVVAPTAAGRS